MKFLGRLDSDTNFYLVFYPHFFVLQNATVFMNRLEFSYFTDIFCKDLKTREEQLSWRIIAGKARYVR
jgi:hypothetical protein